MKRLSGFLVCDCNSLNWEYNSKKNTFNCLDCKKKNQRYK
jgi:hypothetical protein